MKNVLILCGGMSPEHEISIRSAKNIWSELDKKKYMVSCIGISKAGKWQLLDSLNGIEEVTIQGSAIWITPGKNDPFMCANENLGPIDVVIPMLHGPNGEDGAVQGLLRMLGLPFVGCDILGSAVSMDKDVCKRLLKDSGLNVAKWELFYSHESIPTYQDISARLGHTLFVKPANMGSSVGVSRVQNPSEWDEAMLDAFKYDTKVLVEEMIEGRELECAVMGNAEIKATTVGEVIGAASGEFYSYDEKYADSSSTQTKIPADVSSDQVVTLKNAAVNAYKSLNCKGLSRVDMFLKSDGFIYINEVNSMPGFTSISMYPQLWENEGMSFSHLLDKLIDLAIKGD